MIVASAVLTVVAAVLFIVGLFSNGDGMIYGSIGASLAALAALAGGILSGRKSAPTFGGVPAGDTPSEPAMRMVDESPVTVQEDSLTEAAPPVLVAEPETEVREAELAGRLEEETPVAPSRARKPASKTTARKPAAKSSARKPAAKTTARKPAAKTTARKTAATSAAKTTARKTAAKPAARKPSTRKKA